MALFCSTQPPCASTSCFSLDLNLQRDFLMKVWSRLAQAVMTADFNCSFVWSVLDSWECPPSTTRIRRSQAVRGWGSVEAISPAKEEWLFGSQERLTWIGSVAPWSVLMPPPLVQEYCPGWNGVPATTITQPEYPQLLRVEVSLRARPAARFMQTRCSRRPPSCRHGTSCQRTTSRCQVLPWPWGHHCHQQWPYWVKLHRNVPHLNVIDPVRAIVIKTYPQLSSMMKLFTVIKMRQVRYYYYLTLYYYNPSYH